MRRGGDAGGHDRAALERLRGDWLAIQHGPRPRGAGFVVVDEAFQRASPTRPATERGRIDATIEQHLEVMEALLAGDRLCASELLDRHILQSQRIVEEAVGRVLARALGDGEERV